MKIDEKIRKQLLENIEDEELYYHDVFCDYKEDLKNAKTVEEIMECKQALLIRLINGLPLNIDNCYFCLYTGFSCEKCQYAKYHRICGIKESDYYKIMDLVEKLIHTIATTYYNDEKYK